jgi:IS4 transposase
VPANLRKDRRVLQDDLVYLDTSHSRQAHPKPVRRIMARVEVQGQEVEMTCLTNNLEWSAGTIVDLYRCRWQIEAFFKQIKQTLQLSDFLGQSLNAVRWQILDGVAVVCAVALQRLGQRVVAEFHTALCRGAQRHMAALGFG